MGYGAGPQKLQFSIHSCSGEDPDYPARQLLLHAPNARGWQTPRFCSYPQEIVLQLEQQSRLQQIQLLSHEHKIAQRVEIFISALPVGETDIRRAVETRLGYLSFDSNERSGHQARELKSVALQNNPAILVRLVLHRAHVNKLNIYNQAGLVALNLIGEPDERMLPVYGAFASEGAARDPYLHQSRLAQAAMADMQLDLHVDPKTAARIRQLHAQKEDAVRVENYDEAKHLKGCIERLKQLGQKIAQLEARKLAAVEREDFDEAKALKQDIDKLRAAGESVAMGGAEAAPRRANDPDEIFNRVLARNAGAAPTAADDHAAPPPAAAPPGGDADEPRPSASGHYDDQPVGAAGGGAAPPFDNPADATSAAMYSATSRSSGGHDGRATREAAPAEDDAPQPPPGFSPDLPAPAPLSTADANDGDALTAALGEYAARCMYSKNWQHRSAAFRYMTEQVANGSLKDHKLLIKYLLKGLQEKVAALVLECGALVRAATQKGGKVVMHLSQSLLPLLLERLGDGNARIADTMREVLLDLADNADCDVSSVMAHLLRPLKKMTVWRPLLVRLTLLEELVPKFNVNRGKDSFDLSELMAFVSTGFSNANGDVRAASVRVTVAAFKEVGQAVTRFIPADINPKVRQQIFEAIGLEPDVAPPAPAAALPDPPKAAARRNSSAPRTSTTREPPAKAPAKAKDKPKPKSGFAATLPGLVGGSQAPPPLPQQSQENLPLEDPRVFERELAQKERELGPSHPEVADCLTNIAILYNQRGEQAKALPLYERALAIFEAARGPESQDVAHTLTDLAVLHLEQGREDVGRPLLERALEIQQKVLGPDHPDVTAILDVLHGED